MRTTVTIDDGLLAKAQRLSGVSEKSALVGAGLQALIERESARRLARLGGDDPQATAGPRCNKTSDPDVAFTEWNSDADRRAYAKL